MASFRSKQRAITQIMLAFVPKNLLANRKFQNSFAETFFYPLMQSIVRESCRAGAFFKFLKNVLKHFVDKPNVNRIGCFLFTFSKCKLQYGKLLMLTTFWLKVSHLALVSLPILHVKIMQQRQTFLFSELTK